MSRGLGRRQVAILATLADHPDGLVMADLAGTDYVTASSSRRALAGLKARGLVTGDTYYPGMPGRPVIWLITDAGRAYLAGLPTDVD